MEHLANHSFMYANRLQCVKVGKNVKTIKDRCFYDCHDLRHVYIGDGVESLEGDEIFSLEINVSRQILVIGGKAQSAAEHWCADFNERHGERCGVNFEFYLDAISFSLIADDEIDEFLALPLPELRDDKHLVKFFKTMDEIERNKPNLPNDYLPF